MEELFGLQYDEKRYNFFYKDIDTTNQNRCCICGGIISNDIVGPECKKLMLKWSTIYKQYDESLEEFSNTLFLKKWNRYVDIIRNEYIRINLRSDGTPKDFKTQFKKDFFNSINQTEHVTKKQIEIMQKDIEQFIAFGGNANRLVLSTINDVLINCDKAYLDKLMLEYYEFLGHLPLFLKFCKITYSKSWINNPHSDVLYRDLIHHKHELLTM